MFDRVSKAAALSAFGFGLSKAATSIGYLSAMGSVTRSIGFVTELWFMFASEAVSFAFALVLGAWAARGMVRPRSLPQWPALVVFVAGFALSMTGVLSGLPEPVAAGLLGLFYGASSFLFCVTWLEEFAYRKPYESHACMVAGLCIQMVVVVVASFLPHVALASIALLSALASFDCHFAMVPRAKGEGDASVLPTASEAFEPVTARAFVAKFGAEFACLFVLVGVVGILHTSVLGSSFEHIVGDVSMWVPLAAATLITAVAAMVALRSPDPASVYKAVLPVMLVLLSLLPFIGDLLGPLAGSTMIACYDICGMLFLFFIVDVAYRHKQQSYLLSSVYMGGSNAFLALGLVIGLALNHVSGGYDISLMTLLAFAAMYPLCIAFVVVMRRSMRGMQRAQARPATEGFAAVRLAEQHEETLAPALANGEAVAAEVPVPAEASANGGVAPAESSVNEAPAPSAEPDWEEALHDFAARYKLTKRETEICSYLVRGRSAKRIAEELFISENTVWTHTKNVYAKTKVSGKDDLMNLFEHEAFGRRS